MADAPPAAPVEEPRPIEVGGTWVQPGQRRQIDLPVARLLTGTWAALPVTVLNGRQPGPRLWLDAAIHGDELNGMEIIREVLARIQVRELCGTILAVPVVNVFGFLHQTRYLPDRRDLNRSFPGSSRGSLAARIAHLFLQEIVGKCQFGIDLHTGALHRTNLPQVRANLRDPQLRRLAEVFGAPLMYTAPTIPGSLRAAADARNIQLLVYEAGEPLRFNRDAIDCGVRGVLRVLHELGMWPGQGGDDPVAPPFEAGETRWLRASRSGIFYLQCQLGQRVANGQVLGHVADPFSARKRQEVKAPADGLVIGFTHNPLVYQGDALLHLAMAAT